MHIIITNLLFYYSLWSRYSAFQSSITLYKYNVLTILLKIVFLIRYILQVRPIVIKCIVLTISNKITADKCVWPFLKHGMDTVGKR